MDPTTSTTGEDAAPAGASRRTRFGLIAGGVVLLLTAVAYFNITIFVLQPIGAVPEGRTLVLWRKSEVLRFIDSADAICQRQHGGVSMLCRIGALAGTIEHNPIIVKLPYMPWLYSVSTGGREYRN
jgi:hypothetical protein